MKSLQDLWKQRQAQKHLANGLKIRSELATGNKTISADHPCDEFIKVLEHDLDHDEAWELALSNFPTHEHLKKLSILSVERLQRNGKDVRALRWRAQILESLGQDHQALRHYDEMLEIDPRIDMAWAGKGRLLKKVSRTQLSPDLQKVIDSESYYVQQNMDIPTKHAVWAYRQGFFDIAYKRLDELRHRGSPHAELLLGRLYLTGKGVVQNLSLGISLCKKAAVSGDCVAQWLVSLWYQHGVVLEKNTEEAMKWLKKAAENNFPKAQIELAECLEWGFQTERNLTEALYWYERAAETGYWKAYERLAEFYANYGKTDVKKEKIKYWMKQCIEWHESLALRGARDSIEYLIWVYLEGGPVNAVDFTDYARARLWSRIGAVKGIHKAHQTIQQLSSVTSSHAH